MNARGRAPDCSCPCHGNPGMRHMVACCVGEQGQIASTGGWEVERQMARVAHLLALLRSVEWVNTADGETLYCPRCGWAEAEGHSPACPLGAALAGGGDHA